MKIEDPLPPLGKQPKDARKTSPGAPGSPGVDKDMTLPDRTQAAGLPKARSEVTLSQVARQMSAEPHWADSARLSGIQDAIRKGKYRADPTKIADKLIASVGELLSSKKT